METNSVPEKKRVNKGLFLLIAALATVVIGAFTMKVITSRPDIKVTKQKITRAERAGFKEKVDLMVARYTVRREGDMPIIHPPAGSDIYLLARNYDWGKFILELEKGKSYRLHLASLDMRHAIVVHELELMNRIKPDEFKVIEFTPGKAGRFRLICGEWCGTGHAGMVGTIIVTEPAGK
ncbi:MAG: hypothetical protein BMS9Abin18_0024 [Zetaproteobacteria bacterium]|nr:MAG: hypothetical protein BMS9Abin18_0024 [Zetaproteobacteria bacterium]